MALQDINQMFSIVKPDGTPTDYFMRLLRDRGETTQSLEEQVVDLDTQVDTLTTQLSGKADKITNLSAGSGLAGGGDLSADRSFSLNAGLDLLTDVDTSTTPPTDGQALVWVGADSLWKPGTVSGGGGGGGGGFTPLAMVQFTVDQSTFAVTVNKQTNVSSVTRTGTGMHRITFTTALPDTEYSVQCNGRYADYPNNDNPKIGPNRNTGTGNDQYSTTTLDIVNDAGFDILKCSVLVYNAG